MKKGWDAQGDGQRSHEIIGHSPATVELRCAIEKAARGNANALIVGETGTGKELVARSLHALSRLGGGPFVAHNCATVSVELFDTAFFGHRRGAFTGAQIDHTGLLRRADRGVLFIDELECLSAINQAKLLRVLDDGCVRPVGADEMRPVSVRFVAATKCAPERLMATGELRADFYYRLCGYEINVPPLRTRLSDVPELVEYFLRGTGKRCNQETLSVLMRYDWPGNVRELKNAVACASVNATDAVIELQHFSGFYRGKKASLKLGAPVVECTLAKAADAATVSLQEVERQAILQALQLGAGNRSRAAQLLGIHRSTLRRKLQGFKLETWRPEDSQS